jgi:hypothetical protein
MNKCKTCGCAVNGTKECTNCWEVERRLEEYAKSQNGRIKIVQVLIPYLYGEK